MLELCKALAMPVHRPHAPYVDVPKWERKMVIISSLAFVYETDNRIAKIRFLFLLVVDRYEIGDQSLNTNRILDFSYFFSILL